MHPELMHLANQAHFDELRREAAQQHRSGTRRIRFWRRRVEAVQPLAMPIPAIPSPASLLPAPPQQALAAALPMVPAQVERTVAVLAQPDPLVLADAEAKTV